MFATHRSDNQKGVCDCFFSVRFSSVWGFVVPLRHWFRDAKASGRIEALADRDCPLDMASVRRIVRDHQQGFEDYGNFLWMLLVYVSWFGEKVSIAESATVPDGIRSGMNAMPAGAGG